MGGREALSSPSIVLIVLTKVKTFENVLKWESGKLCKMLFKMFHIEKKSLLKQKTNIKN